MKITTSRFGLSVHKVEIWLRSEFSNPCRSRSCNLSFLPLITHSLSKLAFPLPSIIHCFTNDLDPPRSRSGKARCKLIRWTETKCNLSCKRMAVQLLLLSELYRLEHHVCIICSVAAVSICCLTGGFLGAALKRNFIQCHHPQPLAWLFDQR